MTKRPKRPSNAPNPTGAPWPVEASLRYKIALYELTRHLRGGLTVKQVKTLAGLLEEEAEVLDQIATGIKRKPVELIEKRIARMGLADDSLTKIALIRIKKTGITAPKTADEFRRLAKALATAAEYVRAAPGQYLESAKLWRMSRPSNATGRVPNIALEGLLRFAMQLGMTDGEIAQQLVDSGQFPDGPGSDDPDPVLRWIVVFKSIRARRRLKAKR